MSGGGAPKRLPDNPTAKAGYFDLTPSDEQQMIVETVREFAAEILRPAATTPTLLPLPLRIS